MKRFLIVVLLASLNNSINAQNSRLNFPGPPGRIIQLSTGNELLYMDTGDETGMPVIFLPGEKDFRAAYEMVFADLTGLHVFIIKEGNENDLSDPCNGYESKDFALDLATFIKTKHLGSVIVIGDSSRWAAAQRFAVDFPPLTNALILLDLSKENTGLREFIIETSRLLNPFSLLFPAVPRNNNLR